MDFKTAVPHPDIAEEVFLANEVSRYRPQLERYGTAAALLFDLGSGGEPNFIAREIYNQANIVPGAFTFKVNNDQYLIAATLVDECSSGDSTLYAFDGIESAWPVHGSVLVQDGMAQFVAGRSSLLDGGMYAFALNIATGEADRLRNLVNRMLGPNNVPAKQPVNIHQILEHVRSLVDAENYPGLVIERQYDPSIPELRADSELLVQAFLNLVRNAAEAGAARIALRTRTERQFTIGHNRYKLVLRIDVIDDGPGVPAELQEKIFYPMVTGRAEGSGLGLSIAQTLINQHQGIIEFTSAAGNTVFTVFLPLEVTND